MPYRYFLSDVITEVIDGETTIRPAINAVAWPPGTSVNYEIAAGVPHVLCKVSHPVAVPAKGLPAGVDALPDYPPDVILNAMDNALRLKMAAVFNRRGIGNVPQTGAAGYRGVIRALGMLTNPNFDENVFGLARDTTD